MTDDSSGEQQTDETIRTEDLPSVVDTPSQQPPAKKRRWLRRIVWLTLLSPLFFIVASNAWLLSPWGKSWICGKIKSRIELDASIGSAWWIPGGKLHLADLTIHQPEELRSKIPSPVASVKNITLQPRWQQILRGKRDFFSCEIESPDIVLSLEMLRKILATNANPLGASAPANTQTPILPTKQPPLDVAINQNPQAPPPNVPEGNPSNPAPPPATPSASDTKPNPADATPPPPPASPESWIFVRNARIRLLHANSGEYLFDLRDITTDIPIEGPQAKGRLSFASLEIYHQKIYEKTEIPLEWKSPLLQMGPKQLELDGIPYEFSMQFLKADGIPFSVVVQQPGKSWGIQEVFHAEQLQSLHRGAGLLTHPLSWQAESIVLAANLRTRMGGMPKEFHFLQSRCILTGGVLRCTDFRLISDELSLLGNGMILPNANLLGVLRVVASPRDAAFIDANLTKLTPETPQFLPPFGNPDRRGNDFLFGGDLFHTWVSLDGGKNLLDLRKVLAVIKSQRQSVLQAPSK